MAIQIIATTEQLRRMVRISNNKLDDDLEAFKDAFLTDLEIAGVDMIPVGDQLAISCLQLYLRWMFNYNGEAERYRANYMDLKESMRKSSRYHLYTPEEVEDNAEG